MRRRGISGGDSHGDGIRFGRQGQSCGEGGEGPGEVPGTESDPCRGLGTSKRDYSGLGDGQGQCQGQRETIEYDNEREKERDG